MTLRKDGSLKKLGALNWAVSLALKGMEDQCRKEGPHFTLERKNKNNDFLIGLSDSKKPRVRNLEVQKDNFQN